MGPSHPSLSPHTFSLSPYIHNTLLLSTHPDPSLPHFSTPSKFLLPHLLILLNQPHNLSLPISSYFPHTPFQASLIHTLLTPLSHTLHSVHSHYRTAADVPIKLPLQDATGSQPRPSGSPTGKGRVGGRGQAPSPRLLQVIAAR